MHTQTTQRPTVDARNQIEARLRVLDAIDQATEDLGVECDQFGETGWVAFPADLASDADAAKEWIERHVAIVSRATEILGWERPTVSISNRRDVRATNGDGFYIWIDMKNAVAQQPAPLFDDIVRQAVAA